MLRHAWVLGDDGELSDVLCRRLAMLDDEISISREDLGSLCLESEQRQHPIDVCISHVDMPFELISALAEAMAQRGWGRIVMIEWIDDRTAAAQHGREERIRKLASQLTSRGMTINTIVTSKGNREGGENLPQPASDRLSKYEEIAGLAAYLVSDEAGFLTGARIAFDVGRRLD